MVHDLNPKNLHINGHFFLQNLKNPIFSILGIISEMRFFPWKSGSFKFLPF